MIEGLKDSLITVYQQGDFVDLCRGGHVTNTKEMKHFKLLSIAGAYWRGNSDNKQLTRVYGVSFFLKRRIRPSFSYVRRKKI